MKPGYTRFMGSDTGTLYIGVSSDLDQRVGHHKHGTFPGFSEVHILLMETPPCTDSS